MIVQTPEQKKHHETNTFDLDKQHVFQNFGLSLF
jgi:hypothetical protein